MRFWGKEVIAQPFCCSALQPSLLPTEWSDCITPALEGLAALSEGDQGME